ncbi:MAG TPA: cupin domain-containing protein [Pseudonocardiaceae bacterium]
MTATTDSDSVLVCSLDDVAWQRIGKHRGPGIKMKSLAFRGDGRGNNLWLSLSEMEDGWFSPRHRHNFDQIRYVVDGETGFTEWDLHAGECAYFPAGVHYGPQEQHGAALLLTLQFPGSGGDYYLTPEQVEQTVAALRAENPEFGKGGKGFDKQGRERDSYEIVYETHQGQPVRYPDSDFTSPVLFDRDDSIVDEHISGADVTLVGRIESNGLRVLRATSTGPLRIRPATPTATEFWILDKGAIALNGRRRRALTVIQLLAGAPGVDLDVLEPATFTVLRLPELANA